MMLMLALVDYCWDGFDLVWFGGPWAQKVRRDKRLKRGTKMSVIGGRSCLNTIDCSAGVTLASRHWIGERHTVHNSHKPILI
jgi:hypothetical protein